MSKIVLKIVCVILLSMPYTMIRAMSADIASEKKDKDEVFVSVVADTRQDIENSKQVIKEIIQKEPFIHIEQERIWNFEKDEELEEKVDIPWLNALMNFLAILIEAILWMIPLVILFYVYRYRAMWMKLLSGKKIAKSQAEIPHTLFGLELSQQSLPDDIEAVALKLWQEEHYRDAVSLLYRASLSALFKRYDFQLNAGATELDCIQQIERSDSAAQIEDFKQLTNMWMSLAYAHQLPNEQCFKEQCRSWTQTYLEKPLSEEVA